MQECMNELYNTNDGQDPADGALFDAYLVKKIKQVGIKMEAV